MNLCEPGEGEKIIMSQSSSYELLSQMDSRHAIENERQISLEETSDEVATSSEDSSQDSLDLVLLEIGNKRKVRRKKRTKMGISNFDAAESYEVSEPTSSVSQMWLSNRFGCLLLSHVSFLLAKDIKRKVLWDEEREEKAQSWSSSSSESKNDLHESVFGRLDELRREIIQHHHHNKYLLVSPSCN